MVDTITDIVRKHGNGGMMIYIPLHLRIDSRNPLVIGQDITIAVDGERMIITPINTPL
jgi:antitoxin component of MazEF toxin-antitoxin module